MNNAWQGAGRRIRIQEVGTRDGLQMEAQFVPTADKIALIDALSQTGLAKIEVTSFTSPKAIPALRDAEIVMREIARVPGVVYTALVPNVRGAERAIESRTDELNLVMSTSETHNLANLRMTRERSFAGLTEVVRAAQAAGVPVNVSLSCVFGCPMEGDVAEREVFGWAQRFVDLGVQGLTLCDTTGMAFPTQVAALTRAARERWPGTELTLHFHNTRGMGLANVLAAIDAGRNRRVVVATREYCVAEEHHVLQGDAANLCQLAQSKSLVDPFPRNVDRCGSSDVDRPARQGLF